MNYFNGTRRIPTELYDLIVEKLSSSNWNALANATGRPIHRTVERNNRMLVRQQGNRVYRRQVAASANRRVARTMARNSVVAPSGRGRRRGGVRRNVNVRH